MNGIVNGKDPLAYGRAACDTIMRKYAAPDLPPKGQFHYHQGVFLSGMHQIYQICGEEKYFQYIKDWVDSIVDENGAIDSYNPGMLDDLQAGNLLFPLLERTGDERYQMALDEIVDVVANFWRNELGGFWHKKWHPNQMWLDGLYMAGPLSASYGRKFDKPEMIDCAIEQALLMRRVTEDPETGLWYHAWDCSRKAKWADKETGSSPEFWGRAMGWVPVAVLNELDDIPEDHPDYSKMCDLVKDLLTALCKYQSGEGRWYQVVDKGDQPDNWLENSCSCLYVAAICKAVRKGLLDGCYMVQAWKGYEAVIKSLKWQGEDIQIGNVCIGTGVGDYRHYIDRPTSTNDLHGVGAFNIMCAEAQMSL